MLMYRGVINVNGQEFPTAVEQLTDGSIGYVWAWDNWSRKVIPIYRTVQVREPELARDILASYEVHSLVRELVLEYGYKTRKG